MPSKEEDALNLYAKHEAYVLSHRHGAAALREVPAVVVTGFLGAGKTTLLNHILRNRGDLRIAVLVNEVGAVDLDSQLVNLKQSNAAVGMPASDLSGGCICCTAHGGLRASLAAIRDHAHAHAAAGGCVAGQLDYLIVETSGVADAEPLAAALASAGFSLEAVVAVVDAEAGVGALRGQEVAVAQVRVADVVVVNKCDVAGLGSAADVEDEVRRLAGPGVRLLRARYGQVPLPAILDVEPCENSTAVTAGGVTAGSGGVTDNGVTAPGAPTVKGEVAFLSHEASLTSSGPSYRAAGKPRGPRRAACLSSQPQAQASDAGQQQHEQHQHDHSHSHSHDHARLHSPYHTTSVTTEAAVNMAGFQALLARMVVTPGLLRCKGILKFTECPAWRYTAHLSGRQRVEVLRAGPWEGAPVSQLVLIGSDPAALAALREQFVALTHAGAEGLEPGGQAAGGAGAQGAVPGEAGSSAAAAPVVAAAEVLRQRLPLMHERLSVLLPPSSPSSSAPSAGEEALGRSGPGGIRSRATGISSSSSAVVEFQVVGDALHGVRGGEVAAGIMRRANGALARTGLVLLGVPEPPAISATGMGETQGGAERIEVLQCVLPLALTESGGSGREGPGGVEGEKAVQAWAEQLASAAAEALADAAGPVMRKAFAHTGCRCDVVAEMHAR